MAQNVRQTMFETVEPVPPLLPCECDPQESVRQMPLQVHWHFVPVQGCRLDLAMVAVVQTVPILLRLSWKEVTKSATWRDNKAPHWDL